MARVVAAVPVVAVVAAAPIECLKKTAAIGAAATATAVAAEAAGAPARFPHAGWEAGTYWPRARPRRPRCCRISKRGRVWRAPAAGCYAGQCREPARTPPFVGHRPQPRPGWEAATRRSC